MGVKVTLQRTSVSIEGYTGDLDEAVDRMNHILRDAQQET